MVYFKVESRKATLVFVFSYFNSRISIFVFRNSYFIKFLQQFPGFSILFLNY